MPKEIERKFLLKNNSWRKKVQESCQIRQGYLFLPEGVLRIRMADKQAFLTVKTHDKGLIRNEYEYPIPMSDAEELIKNICCKPCIEKTRNKIKIDGLIWEVDEFSGENEGLVIVEVELQSETQKFKKPNWVGHEVSGNLLYYNSNLVNNPFSKWFPADRLARFRPLGYSPILNIKLSPENCIGEEIKKIFSRLLWIIEKNEKGIIDDIDPNFLHDLRVATRKTRSLLTKLKSIFPEKINDKFRKDFANIAKCTNHLRDLDVFIHQQVTYKKELPEQLWKKLSPLFEDITEERRIEHKKALKFLDSEAYRDLKTSWRSFLSDQTAGHEGELFKEPSFEIAKSAIKKTHKSLIKAGSKMNSKSPAKEFHALRIKGKKLRYMMEAFCNLFDTETILHLMKQLKALQDNLGIANDISVQVSNIKRLAKSHQVEKQTIKTLISLLQQKQQDLRSEFKNVFGEFASKKNGKSFKELT